MKNIGKHFTEYYQNGKYLGSVNSDGEIPQNEVGYENRVFSIDEIVYFKKKYTASTENPFTKIKYNLQGRFERKTLSHEKKTVT